MAEHDGTSEPKPASKPISETVEEVASEGLGVNHWDRPAIFRETAEAAVESDLPYWTVLILSGAIATLGLSLNSSAVVIGAMLVAPLLAPVIGLALALTVGDGRLALQTAVVVVGSTVAVVGISALLTALLPFHTITLEISARTRPSTLDLGIAVFSGLAGAVVTVARGRRLSAAIPGVAIAVALIPPLAVAGFGIGSGWRKEVIYGSMLLYGANLAGIVLSGMAVFLLVGMHRRDVVEAALRWHRKDNPRGLTALADRSRWVRSLGILRSAWARVGLALLFVAAVSIPLGESLAEIAREARLERAIGTAQEAFEIPGRAAVLHRQIVPGEGRTQVYLRVATAEWFGAAAREEFERTASALAEEPVRLSLEQLPASGGDLDQFAALLPGPDHPPGRTLPPPAPARLADILSMAQDRLEQAVKALALPEEATVVGAEIGTAPRGGAALHLTYAAPDSLTPQAVQMLRRQLQHTLELPAPALRLTHLSTAPRSLNAAAPDTALLRRLAEVVQAYDSLHVEMGIPAAGEPADSARMMHLLQQMGVDAARIRPRLIPAEGSQMWIRTAPGQQPAPLDAARP